MPIAWTSFTPWPALAGGLLIGFAAALFLLGSGRIAGITTILASPIHALLRARPSKPELSRGSLRSLLKVLVFMGAGTLTVAMMRLAA